jgi:hypothetical protein
MWRSGTMLPPDRKDLATERGGKAQLRVALDKAAGALREAALDVAERMTPSEGW